MVTEHKPPLPDAKQLGHPSGTRNGSWGHQSKDLDELTPQQPQCFPRGILVVKSWIPRPLTLLLAFAHACKFLSSPPQMVFGQISPLLPGLYRVSWLKGYTLSLFFQIYPTSFLLLSPSMTTNSSPELTELPSCWKLLLQPALSLTFTGSFPQESNLSPAPLPCFPSWNQWRSQPIPLESVFYSFSAFLSILNQEISVSQQSSPITFAMQANLSSYRPVTLATGNPDYWPTKLLHLLRCSQTDQTFDSPPSCCILIFIIKATHCCTFNLASLPHFMFSTELSHEPLNLVPPHAIDFTHNLVAYVLKTCLVTSMSIKWTCHFFQWIEEDQLVL